MSFFGIFGRVRVEGVSMQPTYNPQDWLLVYFGLPGTKRLRVSEGDVVVIEREVQPGVFYIKRITEIKKDSAGQLTYYVRSDNESGTDSRNWGYLRSTEVTGKVITRIRKS
jgi:signal peptidase I